MSSLWKFCFVIAVLFSVVHCKGDDKHGDEHGHSDAAPAPAGGATSFYLLKHVFQSPSTVEPFWKGQLACTKNPACMTKFWNGLHDAGFHIHFWAPIAMPGPIYCLWEAAAGKTQADLVDFFDHSPASPSAHINPRLSHEMHLIPPALTGNHVVPQPFNFATRAMAPRIPPTGSTWYLTKHTFTNPADIAPFWVEQVKRNTNPAGVAQWLGMISKLGFMCHFYLPTGKEGPIYCMWEAEKGKTQADMQTFIDKSKLSPVSAFAIENRVQMIPNKLTGGYPAPVQPYKFGVGAAPPKFRKFSDQDASLVKKDDGSAPAWAFPLFGVVAMISCISFGVSLRRKVSSRGMFRMAVPVSDPDAFSDFEDSLE